MTTIDHVAVVIPAADEQERIGACLDAVRAACGRLARVRPGITVDVVVVLDGCADRTADIAASAGVRTVVVDARCVGLARQAGADAALAATAVPSQRVWLACTDADSRVPRDWLVGHVACAEDGAALVAGTVVPDGDGPTISRWKAVHDPRDGHDHVHGANLGIRADALVRLGGWPPLHTGEDVALVVRAAAAGLPITRTGRYPVHTSDRRVGRAPKGFSSYLAELDTVGRTCVRLVGGGQALQDGARPALSDYLDPKEIWMASGVATVWVPISDMDRALAFYRDTLGLAVKDQPDRDWAEIDANGLTIGLNGRESTGRGGGGAVITFSPDGSLDDEVSRLREAGVEFTGEISEHPWGRIAPFRDSEGNDLQFYAPPA